MLALLLPCLGVAQRSESVRPAITGISHITLFAHEMARSQQFYTGLLGLDQIPRNKTASGVRFYCNHEQYVELISPPNKEPLYRLDMIGLATDNAEAMREYLAAHHVAVPKAVSVAADGTRSFLVYDPDGNTLEFTQKNARKMLRPVPHNDPVSTHILHAGFVVRDRAAADHFYKGLLGFRLYWQGGQQDGRIDYVAMQVPDGTDWLEYMLNLPQKPSRRQLGMADHFSLGVVSVANAASVLEQRGWRPSAAEKPQLGRDGKWQLNLYDPDGTRVELMEFRPVQKPCCAPFTGRQPRPTEGW
jgi:catechol 2,3-dioxygenase-like lactoylglutathione lyase family enzyme